MKPQSGGQKGWCGKSPQNFRHQNIKSTSYCTYQSIKSPNHTVILILTQDNKVIERGRDIIIIIIFTLIKNHKSSILLTGVQPFPTKQKRNTSNSLVNMIYYIQTLYGANSPIFLTCFGKELRTSCIRSPSSMPYRSDVDLLKKRHHLCHKKTEVKRGEHIEEREVLFCQSAAAEKDGLKNPEKRIRRDLQFPTIAGCVPIKSNTQTCFPRCSHHYGLGLVLPHLVQSSDHNTHYFQI